MMGPHEWDADGRCDYCGCLRFQWLDGLAPKCAGVLSLRRDEDVPAADDFSFIRQRQKEIAGEDDGSSAAEPDRETVPWEIGDYDTQ